MLDCWRCGAIFYALGSVISLPHYVKLALEGDTSYNVTLSAPSSTSWAPALWRPIRVTLQADSDARSRAYVAESASSEHISVLLNECVAALDVRNSASYIDATIGLGGHAERILESNAPNGRLLGIDVDPEAIARSRNRLSRFGDRVTLARGNFRELSNIAARRGFSDIAGILFDLGVSSRQLGEAGRGFSFQHAAPLDMRMDPELERTAADIVNESDEAELALMLFRYGEEPAARQIARAIVRERPFTTTTELAAVIEAIRGRRGARIHPATRTFQALRIAVNDELGSLKIGLQAAIELLGRGGRIGVISFHSLEDRIVKDLLRSESRGCICPPSAPICVCSHEATLRLVQKSVIRPSASEIASNPRSRSARLRVAERL
jgi:16S rRNA (cytosine1402-N4)-methyltransferase